MHGCAQIILKAIYIGPYMYGTSICVYSYGTPIRVYGMTDFAPYMPVFDLNMPFATLKFKLKKPFWKHFLDHFDNNNNCTLHYHCPCLGWPYMQTFNCQFDSCTCNICMHNNMYS